MPDDSSLGRGYQRLAVLFLVVNVFSALAFIATVHRPVYDDPNNSPDVQRYAHDGVTLQSIRSHVNPTGPGSFIWIAGGIRLLGGNELHSARLAVFASWLLLSGVLLTGARYSESPELWYAALLTTLVFPHTMTATATLMTEGPALLAAVSGTLAWTIGIAQPRVTRKGAVLLLGGGLALGLAIICRQYYLAFLPAAALVAFLEKRKHRFEDERGWILSVPGSLALAAIPCFLLILAWKGLSSPSMALGASYNRWKAGVGSNPFRPGIAVFYISVYLALLTFPEPFRLPKVKRWLLAACALGVGLVTAFLRDTVIQPGPLHSLEKIAGAFRHGEFLVVGTVAGLACYSTIAFALLLWEKRASLLDNPIVLFSLLTVVFFVLEQIGVGGNMPFYDRYVLQLAPFLGIVVFNALPGLRAPRLVVFSFLTLLSHEMLWRNAFGG